jgi:ribosome-associated protein
MSVGVRTRPLSARTMPRPDERDRRRPRGGTNADTSPDDVPAEDLPPSKTQRKAEMHALQDMGEVLIGLDPKRLALLAAEVSLPPRLVDAILEARSITAWGGRKRQLQYVGKLMRDVDPDPIRRRLDLWAHGHAVDSAHQHALEQWRDRLLAEPAALDLLAASRPRLDRPRFRALIARAKDERARGQPPHAFRELFRELKALDPEPG